MWAVGGSVYSFTFTFSGQLVETNDAHTSYPQNCKSPRRKPGAFCCAIVFLTRQSHLKAAPPHPPELSPRSATYLKLFSRWLCRMEIPAVYRTNGWPKPAPPIMGTSK